MATEAKKDDVFKMLQAINKRLADVGGEPVEDRLLSDNFGLYWPMLEIKLKAAESIQMTVGERQRSEREILQEILESVREQQRYYVEGINNLGALILDTNPINRLNRWGGFGLYQSPLIGAPQNNPKEVVEYDSEGLPVFVPEDAYRS